MKMPYQVSYWFIVDDCKDQLPNVCELWRQKGYCETQGPMLHVYCKKSCGICT